MKKIQKRLIGFGGLALVAAITTVAYCIPDANAESYGATVDLNVTVISQNPEIKINNPASGAVLTSSLLNIKTTYADADSITYTLSNGSRTTSIPAPDLSGNATAVTGHNGSHDFDFDLKSFDSSTAGYDSYVLTVAVDRNGSVVEDSVSFTYTPASVKPGTIPTDSKNNPIVDLYTKTSVVQVKAIVLNADGSTAFETTVPTNGQTTTSTTLPFAENYMESGTYTVKFITYSYNGYGYLVADQDEATTNLKTQVTYDKILTPIDQLPSDDTPPTPLNPDAGDKNNPAVETPDDTKTGDTVRVVVKDPTTGETVLVIDLPVEEDGTVTIPFDQYNLDEGKYDVEITPYTTDPTTGEVVPDETKTKTSDVTYDGKSKESQPTVNADNGDPVIPITNDGSVEKAKVIITDEDGNVIAAIVIDIEKGQTSIDIPFEELGLEAGDYKVTVITYSTDPKTGELAPNQNPAYVQPIEVSYDGSGKQYQFVDPENKLKTHIWDRNSNAGSSLAFQILTADAARYFNTSSVYLTRASNSSNLFTDSNLLNSAYFTYAENGLTIYLKSAYLATLANGDYILGVKLENGATPTVKFTVKGDTGTKNNIPNPVIDVNVEEGVEMVEVIVYDKNGNEIFRIMVPATSITTNHIELPFDQYGLEEGDYLIAVVPYARDESGELKPLITEEEAKRNAVKLEYGAPEVPNTGNLLSALNISEKDFLITGLIGFAAITAGGVVLLARKETRR